MRIRPQEILSPIGQCRAWLILVPAIFLWFGSAARGQVSGPVLPEITPPESQTPANPDESPESHPSVNSTEQPEFWIASSRRCCQRFQTRCPQGTLQYFAADAENRLAPVSEPAFLGSLNYDVPICFVIHGDLTSFEDVLDAAPSIVKWIRGGARGQPVQFVFYTWPSDDEISPLPQLDISARGERAEFNGCYLAKLITQFPQGAEVSFFGHSFGTRVTSATLHLLAGGRIPGCRFRCPAETRHTYRVVFTAAAIDHNWLNPGQRYGRALRVTDWLLNIHNGADFVINLYPLRTIFGPQALGRVGFSPRDRLRMGRLFARVSEWDVTMGIGARHAWAYYYSRPEIAAVIAPLLVYSQERPGSITANSGGPESRSIRGKRFPASNSAVRSRLPNAKNEIRDSTRTRPYSSTQSGL